MDFVKDHEEFYEKTNNISRIKQGRSVSGRSVLTVVKYLSRCSRPGKSGKGHILAR